MPSLPATIRAAFPRWTPAAPAPPLPGQRQGEFVVKDFRFGSGEQLSTVRIHYTTLGEPRRDAAGAIDNAILLLHGTMGSSLGFVAPPFSGAMFGRGQPFDTERYFVVMPDAIGHGASTKPSDGMRGRFPRYAYGDMVELQHRVVTEGLGIRRLRVVAGTSMGGMHTWLWCTRYPDAIDAAVPVAANPTAITGRNLAWRRLIIEGTTNDPEYRDGDYERQPHGYIATLPLFQLMLNGTAPLEDLLPDVAAATDFVHGSGWIGHEPADANDAIRALDASRDYDPSADLERIRARVLVVQFGDDEIIVPALARPEAWLGRIPRAKRLLVRATPTTRGHSTLGIADAWSREVGAFLAEGP